MRQAWICQYWSGKGTYDRFVTTTCTSFSCHATNRQPITSWLNWPISLIPSTDVIQLTLTLKMTTAKVVKTSVTVSNNSPIQDDLQPDDHTQPTCTYGMTPGFKPFSLLYCTCNYQTVYSTVNWKLECFPNVFPCWLTLRNSSQFESNLTNLRLYF